MTESQESLDPVFDPTIAHSSFHNSVEVEVDPSIFGREGPIDDSDVSLLLHNSSNNKNPASSSSSVYDKDDKFYTKQDLKRYQHHKEHKGRQLKRSTSHRHRRNKTDHRKRETEPSVKEERPTRRSTASGKGAAPVNASLSTSRHGKGSKSTESGSSHHEKSTKSSEICSSQHEKSSKSSELSSSQHGKSSGKASKKEKNRSKSRSGVKDSKSRSKSRTHDKSHNSGKELPAFEDVFGLPPDKSEGDTALTTTTPMQPAPDEKELGSIHTNIKKSKRTKTKSSLDKDSAESSPKKTSSSSHRSKSLGLRKNYSNSNFASRVTRKMTRTKSFDGEQEALDPIFAITSSPEKKRSKSFDGEQEASGPIFSILSSPEKKKGPVKLKESKITTSGGTIANSITTNKDNKDTKHTASPIRYSTDSDPKHAKSNPELPSWNANSNTATTSTTKASRRATSKRSSSFSMKQSQGPRRLSMGVTSQEISEMKEREQQRHTETIMPHINKNNVNDNDNIIPEVDFQQQPLSRGRLECNFLKPSTTKLTRSQSWKSDGKDRKYKYLRRSVSVLITKREKMDYSTTISEDRRAAFTRYKSQLHLSPTAVASASSSGKKKKNKDDKKNSQPTSFLKLLQSSSSQNLQAYSSSSTTFHTNTKTSSKSGSGLERKSSLRRMTSVSNKDTQSDPATTNTTKSVRFATSSGDKVWAMVKTVDHHHSDQVSGVSHDQLWWSEQELDQRQEKDIDICSLVCTMYRPTLLAAMESAQRPSAKIETVELSGDSLAACMAARGLEAKILYPEWDNYRKKHHKAVLAAQEMMRGRQPPNDTTPEQQRRHLCLLNESEWKLLRLQSLKVSRCSQLMALKMAELDQALASDELEVEDESPI